MCKWMQRKCRWWTIHHGIVHGDSLLLVATGNPMVIETLSTLIQNKFLTKANGMQITCKSVSHLPISIWVQYKKKSAQNSILWLRTCHNILQELLQETSPPKCSRISVLAGPLQVIPKGGPKMNNRLGCSHKDQGCHWKWYDRHGLHWWRTRGKRTR